MLRGSFAGVRNALNRLNVLNGLNPSSYF
jgi:hypothetical protein